MLGPSNCRNSCGILATSAVDGSTPCAQAVYTEVRSLTLSPQIVIRDQVRSLWNIFMLVFHVSVSDMARMNLDFWSKLGRVFRPGTWKFNVVDLKRYGRGRLEFMVYATTLLVMSAHYITRVIENSYPGWAMYCSPCFNSTEYICPFPTSASRPRPVTWELPQCPTVCGS